jgi:hypothetical protein
MEIGKRDKIIIYARLIKILNAYGIKRENVSMKKDLVKDYGFHAFELVSLAAEIEDTMLLNVDLIGGRDTRIESIVIRLYILQHYQSS